MREKKCSPARFSSYDYSHLVYHPRALTSLFFVVSVIFPSDEIIHELHRNFNLKNHPEAPKNFVSQKSSTHPKEFNLQNHPRT
jgi:hypothetical protein